MSIAQPYNFYFEDDAYIFETDYYVRYSIEITDGSHYFEGFQPYMSIFELSIKVVNVGEILFLPLDKKVEVTLMAILSNFFGTHENSLVYICDSIDKRHHARQRKFDNWFKKNAPKEIEKYDVSLKTDDMEILASMLLHQKNPMKEEMMNLFYRQIDEYNK